MKNLRRITVGSGPEDVIFSPTGQIYTGLRNEGRIVRIETDGAVSNIAHCGGMPLGLEWMPDGRILVCNAGLGPQLVDIERGTTASLPVTGVQVHLANNAHVLADGTVFLSDSSAVHPLDNYMHDIIEDTASGRLLRIDPDGSAKVLLDGLSFANGVVVLEDQGIALVAETAKRLIHAVPIDGGPSKVWAETPGHPDNLSLDVDGNVLVAIPSLPDDLLPKLHNAPPLVRKAVARMPTALQPAPQLCCRLIRYSPDGTESMIMNGDTDTYSFVTSARQHDGRIAMGSIEHTAIAVFDLD